MPNALDLGFLLLIMVLGTLFETYYFVPRFRAEVSAGVPDARRKAYRRAVIGQWVCAAVCLALWMRAGRSWTDLGVAPSTGVRTLVAMALIAVTIALAVHQVRAIRRATPERLAEWRPKFGNIEFLLPHTRDEYRWFIGLSISAGVCEELLYRGYLLWVLGAYIGLVWAVVVGVVLFGVGHAYQGRRGAMKTAVAGLVMSLVYVASGWLVPAMILHALIDASAGELAFRVLQRNAGDGSEMSAASAGWAENVPLGQ